MKVKLRLYTKKIVSFVLLLAVVVTAAAFSVTPKKLQVSAETVVTDKSAGGYDAYTTATNNALGITGSTPDSIKSGDVNFEFGKAAVKFSDIKTTGFHSVKEFPFSVDKEKYDAPLKSYENMNIYVDEMYLSDLIYLDEPDNEMYIELRGEYSAEYKLEQIYLKYEDFSLSGKWYFAPLSKWFNDVTYESFYADGHIEAASLKSTNIPFNVSTTPPKTENETITSYKASLNFDLKLKNSDLKNLESMHDYYYYFDLWRDNGGKSQQLITRYVVFSNRIAYDGQLGDFGVAKKDFTYSKGKLDISPSQKVADMDNTSTSLASFLAFNGYEILQSIDFIEEYENGAFAILPFDRDAYLKFDETSGTPTIHFKIDTDDYDAKYRCYFGYIVNKAKTVDDYWWFIKTGEHSEPELERAGSIWTESTSIAEILESYDKAEMLDKQYSGNELAVANKILNDKSIKTVELVMLEQIEGTPFAHKVEKNVTLPVRNGKLSYDTICQALNVSTLKCLNSNVESVVTVNSDGVYELVYLSAVWLHTASVSGAAVDSFLSINESYETFYNRQTGFNIERDQNGRIITGEKNANKQVLTIGMYEYFLNEIKNKYPQLESYAGNEIYGYWGFFAIPQEFNLDAAWKEVFGTSTQYKNVAHYFRHDVKLSNEAYNMLLNDYGHSYLSRVFQGVVGGALGYDATYFMVYVDDAGYAAATENGTTDPGGGGLTQNKVQEVAGKVGTFFDSVVNGALDFFNNNIGANISAILTIAVVIIVVIVLIKTGIFNGIFSGKNKNGRKKK